MIKNICKACKGDRVLKTRIRDLSGKMFNDSCTHYTLWPCHVCDGKGYITQEDRDRYLHSMGIIKCLH